MRSSGWPSLANRQSASSSSRWSFAHSRTSRNARSGSDPSRISSVSIAIDTSFAGVQRVKVRHSMLGVVHRDRDSVEDADPRHPATLEVPPRHRNLSFSTNTEGIRRKQDAVCAPTSSAHSDCWFSHAGLCWSAIVPDHPVTTRGLREERVERRNGVFDLTAVEVPVAAVDERAAVGVPDPLRDQLRTLA
jgi:hypothetical protein